MNIHIKMPCYGHSHCALCNIPVCPDCIGNNCDQDDEDDNSLSCDININDKQYKWLNVGVAIYENGEIYEVTTYEEGIMGVLCDANDENKYHSNYANIKSALFLHKYCYNYVLKNINIIPIQNMWWFLAVYNIGSHSHKLKDESNYFHPQNSLHQYYHKGNYDPNTYENETSFMWLLKNPFINEQNKKRIDVRFQKMITTYNWEEPFSIVGYKLK